MTKIRVEHVVQGILIREGAGVKLHRYIGVERSNDYEPLLLLDYFNSQDPIDFMAGFPAHPHRGFETITYLLEGQITHEDNQGHHGTIKAGDVQWMTAGKGIVHSEMPFSDTGKLQGLQLWLNLPAANKMDEARYQEISADQLPVELDEHGNKIKVIAGTTNKGTSSPIEAIKTQPLFLDIHLRLDHSFEQRIEQGYQAILLVLKGSVRIGEQLVQESEMAKLSEGSQLEIYAEQDSHALLIAATKLKEPIARHGPFVMNTHEEVMQALHDFQNGKF